jgi:hypothetical protein
LGFKSIPLSQHLAIASNLLTTFYIAKSKVSVFSFFSPEGCS